MKADGAKEKLLRAFDQAQARFEDLCSAQARHKVACEHLAIAEKNYEAAKAGWESTLKTCSPGNEPVPATPCTSGENTPTGTASGDGG